MVVYRRKTWKEKRKKTKEPAPILKRYNIYTSGREEEGNLDILCAPSGKATPVRRQKLAGND